MVDVPQIHATKTFAPLSCITLHDNFSTKELPLSLIALHDPSIIEQYMRHNTLLHIYELGDLDAFFWNQTQWYALTNDEEIEAVALLYIAFTPPILIVLTNNAKTCERMVSQLAPFLPRSFYSILSIEAQTLLSDYTATPHGLFHRFGLQNKQAVFSQETMGARVLTVDDLPAIHTLYNSAYPDVHFDPRTLETTRVYGIERDNQLVTIAGIHVYSETLKVAAIGNVTTHPAYRGQGLAIAVCAAVCRSLLEAGIEHIGLNVRSDNAAALAIYRKLGFVHVADFYEASYKLK